MKFRDLLAAAVLGVWIFARLLAIMNPMWPGLLEFAETMDRVALAVVGFYFGTVPTIQRRALKPIRFRG